MKKAFFLALLLFLITLTITKQFILEEADDNDEDNEETDKLFQFFQKIQDSMTMNLN